MGLRNQQALFFMYFGSVYTLPCLYTLLNKRAKPSLLLVAVLA